MQLLVLAGFVIVSTAWAGDRAKSLPVTPALAKPLSTARQQLASSQAEVEQLEQDLGRQESDSRRASERLQQQDQAIAELHKQLDELQAVPVPGAD
nr:BREX-1 system adenine-specific DNA-methyltransferase PglX [Rhodanobacter sp. B2A1Ga4]